MVIVWGPDEPVFFFADPRLLFLRCTYTCLGSGDESMWKTGRSLGSRLPFINVQHLWYMSVPLPHRQSTSFKNHTYHHGTPTCPLNYSIKVAISRLAPRLATTLEQSYVSNTMIWTPYKPEKKFQKILVNGASFTASGGKDRQLLCIYYTALQKWRPEENWIEHHHPEKGDQRYRRLLKRKNNWSCIQELRKLRE